MVKTALKVQDFRREKDAGAPWSCNRDVTKGVPNRGGEE